jgi:hypothetical protein
MEPIMNHVVYGTLIAALLLGGGGTAYYFGAGPGAQKMIALDEALCRTDQPLSAHRAILVDTTDVLSGDERNRVREVLNREEADARPYEKVSVFSVEAATPYAPKRLFAGCAPKKAADASPITENPAMYASVWKRKFAKPLDNAMATEMGAGPQAHSPIIESLWAISRMYDFDSGVAHRRIVIASDMLQNSADFSQYRGATGFAAYAHTEFGRLHMPNLAGVDVEIVYFVRPETIRLQTQKHLRFWTEFFRAAGAVQVQIIGGPGA